MLIQLSGLTKWMCFSGVFLSFDPPQPFAHFCLAGGLVLAHCGPVRGLKTALQKPVGDITVALSAVYAVNAQDLK